MNAHVNCVFLSLIFLSWDESLRGTDGQTVGRTGKKSNMTARPMDHHRLTVIYGAPFTIRTAKLKAMLK